VALAAMVVRTVAELAGQILQLLATLAVVQFV
jgi:hypothetical protein